MWNSDFRMFEQKEFVKIKMNRIKDFQQEQAESQMPVDIPVPEDRGFTSPACMPNTRRRHPLPDKQPAEHLRKEQLDKRYKLFMHIADFYAMWLSDKKQLWSIEQNIRLFKANLEECEIRLCGRKRKTCARELKNK